MSDTKENGVLDGVAPAYSNPKAGGDAVLDLVAGETESIILDDKESRRLLRKIDLHIMPLICIVYFLQYLDKICISYGSVTGMLEATHLKGNEYSWVASIFYFGQLGFTFPTMRLLQYFPLARYVAVNVFIWGAILACLAACSNYAGLIVCRFLLGCTEAAIVPAWVVFTSQWYRREEQAFRVGIWFSMCGFAQMFGGYVAYGIATHVGLDPNAALGGWQILFLFLGLVTVIVGVVFWFYLPNSPVEARFFTEQEKRLFAERIRENEQGVGSRVFKKEQVIEALTDVNTWLYAFWTLAANIPNSTATSFGNILVTGLGFPAIRSLLLVTPLGAYEAVSLILLTYLAMRTNQRLLVCIAGHIPPLVGAVLMATTNGDAALVGYYLTGGIPIGWTTLLGLMGTNVAGSTKKITFTCINTIAYCVGNIISPQTFRADNAPHYLPAKIAICILYGLLIIDLGLIRWVAVRENRKRDAEKAALGDAYIIEKNHEFLDMTDRQNKEFRYSL